MRLGYRDRNGREDSRRGFPPGSITAQPEGGGFAIVADLAGFRIHPQRSPDALGDVSQVAELGGLMCLVDADDGRSASLEDVGEKRGDVGNRRQGTFLALDFFAVGIEDSEAGRAEDDRGLFAEEGDTRGLAEQGLGEAAAVFPHDRVAAKIVGNDLGVRSLLIVFEVVSSAGGGDPDRSVEAQSPSGEVEPVDTVEAELAGAPVPEPPPVVRQEIVTKRSVRRGSLPEVIVESGRNGSELAEADGSASVGVPRAGEVNRPELAGADASENLGDPGNAAMLEADLEESARTADGFHEEFAFAGIVGQRGLEIDGLTRLQGENGGRRVPVVRRGDDDGLDAAILENAPEIVGGFGRADLLGADPFCGGLEGGLVNITEPGDVNLSGGDEVVQEFRPAGSESHEPDLDGIGVLRAGASSRGNRGSQGGRADDGLVDKASA